MIASLYYELLNIDNSADSLTLAGSLYYLTDSGISEPALHRGSLQFASFLKPTLSVTAGDIYRFR
jgi:hypothetical protein